VFKFTVKNTTPNSLARFGVFDTPHGEIETPVFMPVGTKASVKTLSQQELKDLDSQIILANTYHLYLRPGHELVREMGGLHKWMNWDRPILTDSGGFQVFSLAEKNQHSPAKGGHSPGVKINDNGVEFKSHLDGSKHFFTPERAIQIQHDLGADIIMAFDECAPSTADKSYLRKAMQRTHEWAVRCKKEHERLEILKSLRSSEKYPDARRQEIFNRSLQLVNEDWKFPGNNADGCFSELPLPQALFPIVQGGIHQDLREESAKFINELDMPGNAIGGLAVGESKEEMYKNIEHVIPHLSDQKPRYLMGVGHPDDLLEAVDRGVDMFDCVHPTRIARHGAFWTENGTHSIRNEKYRLDRRPLQENCTCQACKSYSASYIRHLIFEGEILGLRLLSYHNLHFLAELMKNVRNSIIKGDFTEFKQEFLGKFQTR